MGHIHTEPGQYDQTVSAFIVRLDQVEPRIVLHRHKLLGCYLQLGGHVELDENPWHALAHEITEESGYTFDQLQILQQRDGIRSLPGVKLHPVPLVTMSHPFSDTHNHTDIEYAFSTTQAPRYKVAEGESEDIQLFTRDQLMSLNKEEIPDNVRETCRFILDTCLHDWEKVDTRLFEA